METVPSGAITVISAARCTSSATIACDVDTGSCEIMGASSPITHSRMPSPFDTIGSSVAITLTLASTIAVSRSIGAPTSLNTAQ